MLPGLLQKISEGVRFCAKLAAGESAKIRSKIGAADSFEAFEPVKVGSPNEVDVLTAEMLTA